MKNNIILLLIDSMNNTHIKESTIELTPFMNKLKKEGVASALNLLKNNFENRFETSLSCIEKFPKQ